MHFQTAVWCFVVCLLSAPYPSFTDELGEDIEVFHNLPQSQEPAAVTSEDCIKSQSMVSPGEIGAHESLQNDVENDQEIGSVQEIVTLHDSESRFELESSASIQPVDVKPMKLVMEAFGVSGSDEAEEKEKVMEEPESQARGWHKKEEEVWTEHTRGADQKRTSSRRFFSLMNLLKFLLNPVIEEFQEVDKSSSGVEEKSATHLNSAAHTSVINSTDVGDASLVSSSELVDEKKNATDSSRKTKFHCTGRNVTENTTALVKIVNSTRLLELLSFDKNYTTSDCVLVMFYAPWCHFCAATAPHYNAVARAFPQLEVIAVDTVHFSNLNARFGTVAVPNIMLFHQSRSAVRFNHTDRQFQTLVQFITNTTGLETNSSVELSAEDNEGPLSSTPTDDTDYLLLFSWLFIILCSGYIFIFSQTGQRAIEKLNVLWQEHQHIE